MTTETIPTNGMVITNDVTFKAGTYYLPEGIRVAGNNITINGNGALIVSDTHEGVGVSANNVQSLTIKNLRVSGFYHGVRIDDSHEVTLDDLTIRDTKEIEGINTFLYLWLPIEKVYSGAILLNGVSGGMITNCDVQHQMNGILFYNCAKLTVSENNGSFNSGWGVYLSNTNDSRISDNQLDFCNRVFKRDDGSVRVEADAAGIVMVKGSSRNQILRNSLLCGGDGIFLCGYEHPGVITPCNNNLFEDNDCRLSPNNAIESTFSGGNIFRRNDCSRSNYGFWMGYSWDNILEENMVEFSRWVGIAIEHGYDFTIKNNTLRNNGEGIRLWTRGGPVVDFFPQQRVTYRIKIEDNLFDLNRIGFHGYTGDDSADDDCHNFHMKANTFTKNDVAIQLKRIKASSVVDNTFQKQTDAAIRLDGQPDVTIENNRLEGNRHDIVKNDD